MLVKKRLVSPSGLEFSCNFSNYKTNNRTSFDFYDVYRNNENKDPKRSTIEPLIPEIKNKEYNQRSAIPSVTANAVAVNSLQTYDISQSYKLFRDGIVQRGEHYANNQLYSRRGFVAEDFVAGSYNIDATIKKVSDRAIVPESTADASPDIIYDNGQQQASLKFYKDGAASAKAQTNTKYGDQVRVIPADQVEEAKQQLASLAEKNDAKADAAELRGETSNRRAAANIQRDTSKRLASTIRGSEGAESTPLTKSDADEIAKAFKYDESTGNKIVDEERLNSAIEKTGVTQKVQHAKMINELRGIGIAAAVGLGTGFAIGFIVSLAQNGLNPKSFNYAFVNGIKQGGSSALMAVGGTGIAVAARGVTESLTEVVLSHLGTDTTETLARNISAMCTMGVVGSLTILTFSVYHFVELKLKGYTTKECLLRTGQSTLLSMTSLLISIAAQGIWGGCTGMVVSLSAGVIVTGCIIIKSQYDKEVARKITYYSIELCSPSF